MTEFDAAETAVQAALDAGARYADARVMHRRNESMSARNGEIESLNQDASSGIGVRALVAGDREVDPWTVAAALWNRSRGPCVIAV